MTTRVAYAPVVPPSSLPQTAQQQVSPYCISGDAHPSPTTRIACHPSVCSAGRSAKCVSGKLTPQGALVWGSSGSLGSTSPAISLPGGSPPSMPASASTGGCVLAWLGTLPPTPLPRPSPPPTPTPYIYALLPYASPYPRLRESRNGRPIRKVHSAPATTDPTDPGG